MDEVLFYNSVGDPAKKHSTSFGFVSSTRSTQQVGQYRQCYSANNGTVLTGINGENKIISACHSKALVHVYILGKESPEQTIPVPEELICLELCPHPNSTDAWLLVAGAVSGRIYVWELDSGLLLAVKESHYQSVSVIKYVKGYLVSGGADSRVVVWKVLDMMSDSHKPYAIYTDHTLPVTDLLVTTGLVNDLKVWSVSRDQTIRCHDLTSQTLVTTFIAQQPVSSITADPAYRSLYVGYEDGTIRMVNLFDAPSKTQIWEHVGGYGKVITLKDDPELRETFVSHQAEGNSITKLEISFDGSQLISGDSKGKVLVSDVATKQIVRTLKPLAGAVSTLKLFRIKSDSLKYAPTKSSVRGIPVLKRSLVDEPELQRHVVFKKFEKADKAPEFNLERFLDITKSEAKWFTNFTNVDSTVKKEKEVDTAEIDRLREANAALRQKYDELYETHSKLLMNNK
ncbi:hypothetical protein OGAPHI_002595 [Ogataea philodendri]|uniref:Pre-rRNA-processing protein IPI3 n=1 Tax=Ogataea philodendri TaxID=1378263 RepID=A0A9P8T852_9ASCO|nr:uncharacterized protein OGAPHI_002595 [Ogataea philodendri]KAH3668840.1 hypothetical protein OGAPHI_002595 [Ogataea philodendri]